MSASEGKLQPKAEPDAVVVYATLAEELPAPPAPYPYQPETLAVKFVDTAPILKPLLPPVVTVTLRLSNVINVPAFTNPDVNPTIPVPLVPEDPEVPEVPDVPAAGVVKEAENHVPDPSEVPCKIFTLDPDP